MIRSRYDKIESNPKFVDSVSKVDMLGYVPIVDRINNLLASGERFRELRAEEFDIPHDGKIDWDVPVDPTQAKDFDELQLLSTMRLIQQKYAFLHEQKNVVTVDKNEKLADEALNPQVVDKPVDNSPEDAINKDE